MMIDPIEQLQITGIALAQGILPNETAITHDTVVTLAPGARLTCQGQPIGEITEIQHKNGAWHYTARITDPAAYKALIQNPVNLPIGSGTVIE